MFLTKDTKSPYFQLVYFVNGKRTKISTRTSNRKEAKKFRWTFNPDAKPTQQPEPIPQKNSILLSAFIIEYKKYVGDTYSVKYLKKAVTPSFNRFTKFISEIPLNEITPKQIDQFISAVYSTSKFAAALYYRTLKAAFNKALVWNYIQENPFNKIKTPKVTKSYPAYINETELILILNKIEDQVLKDIVTTAFYTGMRLNEIVNMKWDWINSNQNIITVKNSDAFKTKSKRERIIPIHQKVKAILAKNFISSLEFKNDFIFNRNSGIKLNGEFISKQFKKAVRSAEINDNIHFHSLRHSFASALVQRNVSLYAVKELLGHENIKTTQVYSHLTQNSLSNAVCLL